MIQSTVPPALTLGAAGAGAAVASLISALNTGEAHPATGWGHLGEYTHSEPDCSDDGVDPITVIFTGKDVSADWIEAHATSHGWPWTSGSDQYFLDHGECEPFDGQSSDGGRVEDRNHMRYNVADIGGEPEAVSPYLYHAPASPHQEDWYAFVEEPGCFGSYGGNHAVRANIYDHPLGGFVAARQEVAQLWLNTGDGHEHFETQYWDNRDMKEQCDGGLAWSDGYVYIIHTEESGGGPPPVSGRGWYSVPY